MPRNRLDLNLILEHAAAVVDEVGRSELSLGRVASSLGVQSSALYNHVDGLDGLVRGLSHLATRRLGDCLTEASIARSGDVALAAIAHAYRDFAVEHPGQYEFTVLPAPGDDASLDEAHAAIVRVFVRLMNSYGLTDDRAVHAARIVRSAVHGFVSLESIEAFPSPQDGSASFELMISFLANGVGTQAPRAGSRLDT